MVRKGKFYRIGTIFYFIVSSLLIFGHDGFFQDDALLYFNTVLEDINSLYPSFKDYNNDFIWHLWPVNFARFILRIGGNLMCIQFVNSLVSILIIHLITKLTFKIFNEKYSKGIFLLCLLYPNFYIWNLSVFTENWLLLFLLLFINIFLSELKYKYIILGLLLGLIDYVRESSPIIILGLIIYKLLYDNHKLFYRFLNLLVLSFFWVVSSIIIGMIHKSATGIYINKGVVSGYNLVMTLGSEDRMSYSLKAFKKGNIGYIENSENRSFYYKDSAWKSLGLKCITANPIEYVSSFPKKIIPMYINDLTYVNFSYKNYNWFKLVSEYRSGTGLISLLFKYSFLFIINIIFWGILLFQVYRSFILVKESNSKGVLLVILSLIFTALPLFFTSASRYHVIGFVLLLPLCGFDLKVLTDGILKKWKIR